MSRTAPIPHKIYCKLNVVVKNWITQNGATVVNLQAMHEGGNMSFRRSLFVLVITGEKFRAHLNANCKMQLCIIIKRYIINRVFVHNAVKSLYNCGVHQPKLYLNT